MTVLYTKIFGERNTGATYLAKLIEKNFATCLLRGDFDLDRRVLRRVLQSVRPRERAGLNTKLQDENHQRILYSDFGWTHAAPPADIVRSAPHSSNTVFVVITKHPVFFLSSLHARPENALAKTDGQTFEQFLMAPWPLFVRDNLQAESVESPIELWNEKMRASLALKDAAERVVYIRYEDLLIDFHQALTALAEFIPPTTDTFGHIRRATRGKEDLRYEDFQRRYRFARIKQDYRKRDLEYIYRKADSDVMRDLGYREII
ncbi:MAG: hypothetical protein AAFQ36_13435 [Pseudomonadota bacterium]